MTQPITVSETAGKLLACPFCGSDEIEVQEAPRNIYWANCMGCGAQTHDAKSDEQAIAAWNRRAPSPELSAALEEIERLKGARVRELEWLPESALGFHRAITPFGEYVVMPDLNRHFNEVRWWFGAQQQEGNSAPSVDAAKSAAQRDYAQRITSAVNPTGDDNGTA